MTQSLLRIIASISAILFVGLEGLDSAKVLEKCTPESICSVGSCVNGACVEPLVTSEIICGNSTCLPGETCDYPLVLCAEDAVCKPPPPTCVANINLENNPDVNLAKRIINLCATVECSRGYVCEVLTIYCYRPPCPGRIAKCVPINPCAYTTCLKGYKCIPNEYKPTVAQCVPVNPCATVLCKRGYTCNVVTIYCLVPPCRPPYAECVPINPCAYTTCLEGYDCVPSEKDPTVAECKPRDLCATVLCKRGYTCNVITLNCLMAPCPAPYAECVPINPCAYTSCLKGYDCVTSERDPTVAECKPRDLCTTILCKRGYKCKVITLYCLMAPCPPPYRECVPINPCPSTTCSVGNVCTQTEDDPSVAECLPTPCATVKCSSTTTCQPITENCISPKCSRPRALCVSNDGLNPCAVVKCRSGYTCTKVPITSCEAEPCLKFKPVCEALSPCDSNPALCIPLYLEYKKTCDKIICNVGQECRISVFPCLYPPCPVGPRCIPILKGK